MTQEFVTLPREVAEQALEALFTYKPMVTGVTFQHGLDAMQALRAALEQPQNHVPDVGNMVQSGWKLVPVEPTVEMLRAGCGSESPAMFRESLRRETDGQKTVEMVEKIIQRNLNSYRAMLAAAPQPPTTEQSSAVEQQQVEREPVAWIWTELSSRKLTFDGPPAVPSVRDELTKPVWTPLYTNPQPKREPLTDEQILHYGPGEEGAVWSYEDQLYFARAIEAAHNIK